MSQSILDRLHFLCEINLKQDERKLNCGFNRKKQSPAYISKLATENGRLDVEVWLRV